MKAVYCQIKWSICSGLCRLPIYIWILYMLVSVSKILKHFARKLFQRFDQTFLSFRVKHREAIKQHSSGDLVHASPTYLTSYQVVSEWTAYHKILHESGVLNVTKVFDLRGNHDMFDVVRANHPSDYFSKFGIQGRIHPRSYRFNLTKPYGNYSFIFLDATPPVGVRIPLNYYGTLTPAEEQRLVQYASEAAGSNQTFVFGHYTTSTIGPGTINLRELLGNSCFAYLCGHLHTANGLLHEIHALQSQGYLELELGDWKNDRYYRIIAVDHDLVSFVNVRSPTWPVVLVTNPKNSNFLLPDKEPARKIQTSTHIRILVWSVHPILNVMVTIDDKDQGNATQSNTTESLLSPLYTLPWNASKWADREVHTLRVTAVDSSGNRHVYEHTFVVNRAPTWEFPFLSRMALQIDLTLINRLLFYCSVFLFMIVMLTLRFTPIRFTFGKGQRCRYCQGLYRIVHCNSSFLSILGLCFYQCCGPSFVGFLVNQHFGAVFSFGIFVSKTFVVDALTYSLEVLQFVLFMGIHLPYFTWFCGYNSSPQAASIGTNTTKISNESTVFEFSDVKSSTSRAQVPEKFTFRWIGLLPLPLLIHAIIFTCVQLVFILLSLAIPYGPLAAFLCPGRLLPIVVCWFLATQARVIMSIL